MMINKRKSKRRGLIRCLCVMLCMLIMLMPGADALTMRAWGAATYTVTFHANGGMFGTGSLATETKNSSPVTEGKTVTAPTAPKRTGYTFTTGEWYTEPECINKWTVGTGGDPVTSDMTLYAKWTPKTYTVKFMNGTTAFKTVTQEYDSMLGPPQENPTKEGHRFDGWYADKKLIIKINGNK